MSNTITPAQVKELRERTGAGMMECKKALELTQGDIQLAIEELRKKGRAQADKKAGRTAAQGVVAIQASSDSKTVLMVEVNSETDFVARDDNFVAFVSSLAKAAHAKGTAELSSVMTLSLPEYQDQTVEEARSGLVAKVGENIHVRRVALMTSSHPIGTYLHGTRIGVMVELDRDNPELAKDIAMHIAASKPVVIMPEEVSAAIIEKEKEIYLAQAASSNKPPEIIEKMVQGRIKKYLDEISLVGQPFVKDPNVTISQLLQKHGAKVLAFVRFEVGEGIEKEEENFVEAVMSQVKGSA